MKELSAREWEDVIPFILGANNYFGLARQENLFHLVYMLKKDGQALKAAESYEKNGVRVYLVENFVYNKYISHRDGYEI